MGILNKTIILIAAVLVVIIALTLIYVFYPTVSPTPTVTSPTPTTPIYAEVINIGVTDKVTDLDPSNAYDFFTWEVLTNTMEGLVKYKPGTDQLVPGIAERWEVSNDGSTWIFHLKKNASFCDGTPVKAQDFVRSIKRVMTIQGDPSWLVTEFVENVEAVDDYTVKFVLKTPASYFLAVVATPPYFAVHPNYPNDQIVSDATWGGAGPYCIKEFKRDEYLVLEANPYYHGDKPKTKTIVIKFYRDATALRLALENGEVDIAWRTLRPQDYVDLAKNPNFIVDSIPGTFIRYIIINTKMDPVSNVLVRRAIAAAINRTELAEKVFFNTMTPLYSLVPAGMWGHVDAFKDEYGPGPNIELARNLLTQAGYSEANILTIELWYTPTHYGDTEADLATLLKKQLEATGLIKVELKSAEWATYVDNARNARMMLSLFGWYPDYIDPDNFLTPFLMSTANKWTGSQYANPTVDQLLKDAMVKVDQNERQQLYVQVQKILAEEVPFIPLLQGNLMIVHAKNVYGVEIGPPMLLPYYTIYKISG
ncbi:MAG: ABC transporter substrate-binding protein [Desulfurococcaceae archaeon]